MHSTSNTLPENEQTPTKGRWGKYTGIALIAISITALVATPGTMRWLILLEGIIALIGIALFVYARIQFWREINRLRQQ